MKNPAWKRRQVIAFFTLGLGPHVTVAVAKNYVATPEVNWETIVPYVRANVVPELEGAEFHVYVCPAHIDRSAVTPFDGALADFTRVLIVQGMHSDRRVLAGVDAATEAFRQRLPSLTTAERADYREVFWRSLSQSDDLLPRLRALFQAARAEGRLRCWACDKDPSYAPLARRVAVH
jgi:hypothetical protein